MSVTYEDIQRQTDVVLQAIEDGQSVSSDIIKKCINGLKYEILNIGSVGLAKVENDTERVELMNIEESLRKRLNFFYVLYEQALEEEGQAVEKDVFITRLDRTEFS